MRNHKQLGRGQTGRHGLAFLNRTLDDDTVHRRSNFGARQVNTGLRQRRLALRHISLRALDLRLRHRKLRLGGFDRLAAGRHQGTRLVSHVLRYKLFVHQHLLALQVSLGFHRIDLGARHRRIAGGDIGLRRQHRCTGRVHISLSRAHAVLKGLRVDQGDQLPGLDLRVKVHIQLFDLPADLRAHRHLGDGVHRAAGRHRGLQVAALYFGRAVAHVFGFGPLRPPPCAAARQSEHHGSCYPSHFFHTLHCMNLPEHWRVWHVNRPQKSIWLHQTGVLSQSAG